MESKLVPEELLTLRDEIDVIDEEIVMLLSRRFAITEEVGKIKARDKLDSVDSSREEEKLVKLKVLSKQQCLNSEFVLELFQMIFREVVKRHRSLRQ